MLWDPEALRDWIIRGGTHRSSPHPLDPNVQGKVAARTEGDRRRRPRCPSDADRFRCNAKNNAMDIHRSRDEDEAEEMQCSSDEAGAVVKQRSGPVKEPAVMQRCSQEDKA